MINYEHIIDKLNHILINLSLHVDPEVWKAMKRPIRDIMANYIKIVKKMSEDPDYVTEGYNEIRSCLNEDDEKLQDVAASYELDPETLSLNMQRLAELVLKELPEPEYKNDIGNLLKQLRYQVKSNLKSAKNVTRRHLMTILHTWRDKSTHDRADHIYNDVSELIHKVHNQIDTLLKSSNPSVEIESFMEDYNDDLFYTIINRDPALGRASLNQLRGDELELLIRLRWLSGPYKPRESVNSQLEELYHDVGFPSDTDLSTGIELDQLITNFNSIDVVALVKTSLGLIIEDLDK